MDCSFPCSITRGYIGNFILPTDFHFFVGGVGIPPSTKRLNRNMSWEYKGNTIEIYWSLTNDDTILDLFRGISWECGYKCECPMMYKKGWFHQQKSWHSWDGIDRMRLYGFILGKWLGIAIQTITRHCILNYFMFTRSLRWILSGWWFGTFYIFPYIWNNHPNGLIFFRGVETTNQLCFWVIFFEQTSLNRDGSKVGVPQVQVDLNFNFGIVYGHVWQQLKW